MTRLSLQQLKEKKERLLRESNARKSLQNLAMRRRLERKKLKAEIKALENPKSIVAKRVAKRIGKRAGRILLKNAVAFGRHISAVAAEQNAPTRRRRRTKTRRRK